jgi:DnaJ-class molecular chaperone
VSHLYSEKRWNTNGKTKFGRKTDEDVSRFLAGFRTADGTIVDPYKTLQVARNATSIEIKQSYRRLSRKLHPDMVAQMEILPGRW